jgi:hypothetical protein
MSRSRLAAAAFLVASSAWLSQGTIAVGNSSAVRLGLLPTSPAAILIALAASAAVVVVARRAASLTPLALIGLLLLPWLPVPLPPAFLVWSGPLVLTVWLAAAAIVVLPMLDTASISSWRVNTTLAPGLLALIIFSCAAWRVAPTVPTGDEPHYLIITQSLLSDGDLKIENNHRRGDYRAYYLGDLSRPAYYRRGRDGEIYSVHAPGVSLLVLPAFALAGYPGAVVFLVLLSSVSAALAWRLALRVTSRVDAAWFGWAAVVFAPSMLLNAFTVYPDGPGGLLMLTGVWALIRARDERTSSATSAAPWFFHGAMLALLPWLHTRLSVVAGGLGALVLLDLARTRNPAAKASAFLAIPAVSALAWIAFFIRIYGSPDPAIPYRGTDLGSAAYIPGGLAGLLFDQLYGLLSHAPVLIAAFCGLVALGRTRGEFRALPLQLTFVGVPYLLAVTHFAMWWAGYTSPARFFVPLIPALAIPAAAAWAAATRPGTQVLMQASLGLTLFIAAVMSIVDRGRLAYSSRETIYAPWLEWVNHAVDLPHALPSYFARQRRDRQPGEIFVVEILLWIGVMALVWLAVRAADRHPALRTPARLRTAVVFSIALACMVALTVTWRLERVDGLTPVAAQMDLLRRAASTEKTAAFDLASLKPIATHDLVSRLTIRLLWRPPVPGAARDDRPLFALTEIPAGEYGLTAERLGQGGWLMAGIGRDQFALVTAPTETFANEVRIRFPVDVRAIVVRGDEDARQHVRGLRVRPIALLRGDQKLSGGTSRRAVRYGASMVFFMDDRSFPEPNGFWVGGARSSTIVVQPDAPRSAVTLSLRNAPAANELTMEAGAWRDTLHLSASEERQVQVPIDSARGAAAITFTASSGFQPSENDPSSRDKRFLGLMVKVEGN